MAAISPTSAHVRTALAVSLAAFGLCWPALRNGYPLVFADTGTYVSQAAALHLGWDRPPFYSLLIFPLHLRLSLWPVVIAQALAAATLIRVSLRHIDPALSEPRYLAAMLALATGTALPWLASQIMPDIGTGFLPVCLLLAADDTISPRIGWAMALAAVVLISIHLSHLPIACVLLAVLLAVRRPPAAVWRRALSAPLLAVLALLTVNVCGQGRFAIAPYGDTFLLARLLEDGPARSVLARECPARSWRLCAYRDVLPVTADDFLWREDSPLQRLGGARAMAPETGAIVAMTLRHQSWPVLRAALDNFARQLLMARTGDGLVPWPRAVTPWITRLFPESEQLAYASAAQTRGLGVVPDGLVAWHLSLALSATVVCLYVLVANKNRSLRAFALAALVLLPVNAFVTGALSGPHDRYQSRVLWPVVLVATLALPVRRAEARPAVPA